MSDENQKFTFTYYMKPNPQKTLLARLESMSVNAFWVIIQRTYERLNAPDQPVTEGWNKHQFVALFSCPHLELETIAALTARNSLKHFFLLDVARKTDVGKLDTNEVYVFEQTLEVLEFLLDRPELFEGILDWAESDAKAAREHLAALQATLAAKLSQEAVTA